MDTMYARIKWLCDKEKITSAALCREIGVARSSLSELKAGRTKVLSTSTTAKIAKRFGVSVQYLIGDGDGEQDVAVKIQDLLNILSNPAEPFLFDGHTLDGPAREALTACLFNALEAGKALPAP